MHPALIVNAESDIRIADVYCEYQTRENRWLVNNDEYGRFLAHKQTTDLMRIDDNTIVTMSYELRERDQQGPVMEVMDTAYPFIFFFPSDNLLQSFQDRIRSLPAGELFEFTIPSEEAYGLHKTSNVVDIPVERFVVDDEMADTIRDVGQYVAVTGEDGQQRNGLVVEKNPTHLKVDLNHAMAGKDLHFSGRILFVRKAKPDEIIQKRYIMPDGIRF